MREMIDNFLLHLPEATNYWTCRWFATVTFTNILGAVAAFSSATFVGLIVGAGHVVTTVYITSKRQRRIQEGTQCSLPPQHS